MDFLLQSMMHAPFWIGVLKIIFVNIILSGDNAVVIAMACLTLPAKQRLWGMILGAGVAVLMRVIFTIVIAQAMALPFLKIIGGVLLFYVATKLVTEDTGEGEHVESAKTLWRAVRIVAIADIVMSLDNVIAIAAAAESAAAQVVDLAHAGSMKTTLIVIGLATSVPLIIAGSAVLMSLLERFRVLVWGGGALLGWVAGEVIVNDASLPGYVGEHLLHGLHVWGGPIGAMFVLALGYFLVGRRRPLVLDELLAGVALIVWILVDRICDSVFGDDLLKVWSVRGALIVVLVVAYAMVRSRCNVKQAKA